MSNKPLTVYAKAFFRIEADGVHEPNEPILMSFPMPMRTAIKGRKLFIWTVNGEVFYASLNDETNVIAYHEWAGI